MNYLLSEHPYRKAPQKGFTPFEKSRPKVTGALPYSAGRSQTGFTLIEIIVGTALFALIAVVVYQSFGSLSSLVSASRYKITAVDLINERIELIRNLPFNKVGLVSGIPSGLLNPVETFVRDGNTFIATTTIRNIDDPFDGTIGGSPNDLSPADYKMVEVDMSCVTCKNFPPMSVSTIVAPKNLETASTNGALFVRVFDANGVAIPGANVQVVNNTVNPAIAINDVTNAQGMLQIIDAPPGNNAYQISVTKSGYTSDQTYATSVGNPNPTNPNATVALQQVTQTSFTIDRVSSMAVSAVTNTCEPVSGLTFNLKGTKIIGTPSVYKYNQNHTLDGGGLKTISNLEWDNYDLTLTSSGYFLEGVNPLLPIPLLPNANQGVQLVVTNEPASILMVGVKDSSTSLPISGASVTLTKSGYSNTLLTGRGFRNQTDWSGGSGQDIIGDETKYASSDGNVANNNPAGELKINDSFGVYAGSANLVSSTFDTGTTSNFNQITWSPGSQPVQTGTPNVRFQLATNNDSSTWDFLGPDGTSATFYTTSNTNIASANNGNRYVRYKAFLDTADTGYTPSLSDVALTFTSSCIPPGQVSFSGLSNGTYTLSITASGYQAYSGDVTVSDDWQTTSVTLSP